MTGNTRPEAEQLVATGGNGCNNTAANLEKAVNFAQCMRNKGGKDFPGPPAYGPLIDMSRIRSAAGSGARSMPGLRAAADRCTALYSRALGLQGK